MFRTGAVVQKIIWWFIVLDNNLRFGTVNCGSKNGLVVLNNDLVVCKSGLVNIV